MTLKTKKNILEKHLTNSVVNLDYINECLDGEKEPTITVIRIFLEQATVIMKRLECGIRSKNHQEITYASHFFKTSFTTMGISCYNEICEIEDLSRQKTSVTEIAKRLNNMMPSYNKAIDAYVTLLETLESE